MFFCVIVYGMLLSAGLRNIYAENWPCWRGPRGDGTSLETDVPVRWDADTHTLWKTPIPGIGHASPIVWENLVFTATALTDSQERRLLCFDRKTGLCLWQKTVLKASLERKHGDNSFASGTPATDGKYVYVSFLDGEHVVVAVFECVARNPVGEKMNASPAISNGHKYIRGEKHLFCIGK